MVAGVQHRALICPRSREKGVELVKKLVGKFSCFGSSWVGVLARWAYWRALSYSGGNRVACGYRIALSLAY